MSASSSCIVAFVFALLLSACWNISAKQQQDSDSRSSNITMKEEYFEAVPSPQRATFYLLVNFYACWCRELRNPKTSEKESAHHDIMGTIGHNKGIFMMSYGIKCRIGSIDNGGFSLDLDLDSECVLNDVFPAGRSDPATWGTRQPGQAYK